jgi:hypothetical protein
MRSTVLILPLQYGFSNILVHLTRPMLSTSGEFELVVQGKTGRRRQKETHPLMDRTFIKVTFKSEPV